MATILGSVRHAFEAAPRVPLADAHPGHVAGWYALQRGTKGRVLYVGEASDLAARFSRHRRRLTGRAGLSYVRVHVRWVEAAPLLGDDRAAMRQYLSLVETVLIDLFKPEWNGDGFGLPSEDVRWALRYPKLG